MIVCGDNDDKGRAHVSKLRDALCDVARSLRIVTLPPEDKDISDMLDKTEPWEQEHVVSDLRDRAKAVQSELDECEFKVDVRPPQPVWVISLKGQCVATAGNLVMVQGQIKSGKSAVISAMLAGSICETPVMCDLLGMDFVPSEGKAIIHVDTEQAKEDHDSLVRTALRRAGLDAPPPHFKSYWLTPFGAAERIRMLKKAISKAERQFGGIHLVLIDGVCDLYPDVNEIVESQESVEQMRKIAIACNCPVVGVIHENPGTEYGKTRGHLGSQLQRKTLSNLKVAKDKTTEVITLWMDESRKGSVPRHFGAKFKWDYEEQMHVTVSLEGELSPEKTKEHKDDIREIFQGHKDGMAWLDLNKRIQTHGDIGYDGAKKRQELYEKHGLIVKGKEGRWYPRR